MRILDRSRKLGVVLVAFVAQSVTGRAVLIVLAELTELVQGPSLQPDSEVDLCQQDIDQVCRPLQMSTLEEALLLQAIYLFHFPSGSDELSTSPNSGSCFDVAALKRRFSFCALVAAD